MHYLELELSKFTNADNYWELFHVTVLPDSALQSTAHSDEAIELTHPAFSTMVDCGLGWSGPDLIDFEIRDLGLSDVHFRRSDLAIELYDQSDLQSKLLS